MLLFSLAPRQMVVTAHKAHAPEEQEDATDKKCNVWQGEEKQNQEKMFLLPFRISNLTELGHGLD